MGAQSPVQGARCCVDVGHDGGSRRSWWGGYDCRIGRDVAARRW